MVLPRNPHFLFTLQSCQRVPQFFFLLRLSDAAKSVFRTRFPAKYDLKLALEGAIGLALFASQFLGLIFAYPLPLEFWKPVAKL